MYTESTSGKWFLRVVPGTTVSEVQSQITLNVAGLYKGDKKKQSDLMHPERIKWAQFKYTWTNFTLNNVSMTIQRLIHKYMTYNDLAGCQVSIYGGCGIGMP